MIMRAGELGSISEPQKASLMITLGRKRWRQREPFDNDVEPEQPQFFSKSCQLIVTELRMSRTDVLGELSLDKSDVESILGLNHFFDEPARGDIEEPQPLLKFPRTA